MLVSGFGNWLTPPDLFLLRGFCSFHVWPPFSLCFRLLHIRIYIFSPSVPLAAFYCPVLCHRLVVLIFLFACSALFGCLLSSGQLNQCIHLLWLVLSFVLLATILFALPWPWPWLGCFCALMHFIISSLRHAHTRHIRPLPAPLWKVIEFVVCILWSLHFVHLMLLLFL